MFDKKIENNLMYKRDLNLNKNITPLSSWLIALKDS